MRVQVSLHVLSFPILQTVDTIGKKYSENVTLNPTQIKNEII